MGKPEFRKTFIFLGAAALIALASVGWFVLLTQQPQILAMARLRYLSAKNSHIQLENGPCLGKISEDWVLDISHIPRQAIDDQSGNQCPQFINGEVHHFVEMSPEGQIIVVK